MIALFAALLIAPPPAIHTWKDSVLVGEWNQPANWDNGIPGPGDIAYLGGSNEGRVVTLKGAEASVAAVFGGDTLKVDGTKLTVTGDPGQTTAFGTAQVSNGGSIDLAGPGKVLAGEIALDGGALNITGTGVNLSGRINGTGATRITGELDYDDLAGLVFRSSTFENDGVIKAKRLLEINPTAASPTSDGSFAIGTDGRLLARSSLALGPASSVTGGPVEIVGGTFATQGTFAPSTVRTVWPATLALAGTTTVAGGTGDGNVSNTGTVTVTGTFGTGGTYTQSAGLTDVMAGATLDKDVVLNGGTLKGKGTVRSLTNNGGTVEPGASPGTLTVAKDFAQTAGTLRIEVEPTEHDVLAVGGKARLGGRLEIIGSPASPVRFLTASTVSGTWGAVSASCGVSGTDALGDCPTPPGPDPAPVTPAVTATPTPTPTPAITPSPPAPVQPKQASVVFPTRCRARITLRISGDVRRATVSVNGRRVKTLQHAGTVTLRPKRRSKVTVAVTLTDGRTLTRTKTYRTC